MLFINGENGLIELLPPPILPFNRTYLRVTGNESSELFAKNLNRQSKVIQIWKYESFPLAYLLEHSSKLENNFYRSIWY